MGISQGFVSLELTPLKGGSRRRKREGKKSQTCDCFDEAALTLRRALGTRGLPGGWLS